jgi:methylthioribose-1-phosphate isomerase
MTELLTIDEVEKLAYKVWYAKFEDNTKHLLENHTKNMEKEFSMLRKYKSEIYSMFEALKQMQKEVRDKVNGAEFAQRQIFSKLDLVKEIHKKIQHTERKLSYALGEPYDKRNLKKEFVKEEQKEEPESE